MNEPKRLSKEREGAIRKLLSDHHLFGDGLSHCYGCCGYEILSELDRVRAERDAYRLMNTNSANTMLITNLTKERDSLRAELDLLKSKDWKPISREGTKNFEIMSYSREFMLEYHSLMKEELVRTLAENQVLRDVLERIIAVGATYGEAAERTIVMSKEALARADEIKGSNGCKTMCVHGSADCKCAKDER